MDSGEWPVVDPRATSASTFAEDRLSTAGDWRMRTHTAAFILGGVPALTTFMNDVVSHVREYVAEQRLFSLSPTPTASNGAHQ